MPEGPETHRIADLLREAIAGDVLTDVRFVDPKLKTFQKKLRGHAVQTIEARGKALLTAFEGGWTIYTHSQLFGFWRIDDGAEPPHNATLPRMELRTARSRARLFAAPQVQVWPTDAIDTHPFLRKLGPDVVARGTSVRDMRRQLAEPHFAKRTLAELLLDQSFAAGMGNYLRSEVLHAARLAPTRRPSSLTGDETTALAKALLAEPRASYRAKSRKTGRHASPGYVFKVFEKEGAPCPRDGAPIVQVRLAARRLYWCPACQT